MNPNINITPTPLLAGAKVTITISEGTPGETADLVISNGVDEQRIPVTFDANGSVTVDWDVPPWLDATFEIGGTKDAHVIINPEGG